MCMFAPRKRLFSWTAKARSTAEFLWEDVKLQIMSCKIHPVHKHARTHLRACVGGWSHRCSSLSGHYLILDYHAWLYAPVSGRLAADL